MYGMVNRAVEDLVTARFGEETWEKVKRAAGVDLDAFISNEPYPDDLTYKLVTGASQVLGVPAGQVLELFGEHWILVTARNGYGDLLDASGRTLPQFLENLPNFHTRVALIFPALEPPHFRTTDVTTRSLRLHYTSRRAGLSSFVLGLLRGLSKMFDTPIAVEHARKKDDGADHDEFVVSWERAAA